MKSLTSKYAHFFRNKHYLLSVLLAVLLLAISLVVNFYAADYATGRASNAVTDIVLSNIPVYNVDGFFVYGSILLSLFIVWLCVVEPKRIPFVVKSLALFILIRSAFITFTHLGPFPERLVIEESGLAWRFLGSHLFFTFFTGNDFFFSGHTGIPVLMGLIFWEKRWLRIFFFAASLLFGAVVLMAHLHYTIDVLSAFFITYSIYKIARHLFKTDLTLFSEA